MLTEDKVCLIGLFFLSRDQNGKAATIAEGILMVILLVITVRRPYIPFTLAAEIQVIDILSNDDQQLLRPSS